MPFYSWTLHQQQMPQATKLILILLREGCTHRCRSCIIPCRSVPCCPERCATPILGDTQNLTCPQETFNNLRVVPSLRWGLYQKTSRGPFQSQLCYDSVLAQCTSLQDPFSRGECSDLSTDHRKPKSTFYLCFTL